LGFFTLIHSGRRPTLRTEFACFATMPSKSDFVDHREAHAEALFAKQRRFAQVMVPDGEHIKSVEARRLRSRRTFWGARPTHHSATP